MNVILTGKQICIQSIVDQKRLCDEEGEDNEGDEDERQRTPTHVREIIEEELAELEALNARLCYAYSFMFQISEILHNVFGTGEEYHLKTKLCTDPAQVVESIDETADKLIHSVIKTEENNDVAIVIEFDDECPKKLTIKFEKRLLKIKVQSEKATIAMVLSLSGHALFTLISAPSY
ncbi:hypothetical protein PS15m_007369 [Mucor circinelloides]